jgi:hypothetical protein
MEAELDQLIKKERKRNKTAKNGNRKRNKTRT